MTQSEFLSNHAPGERDHGKILDNSVQKVEQNIFNFPLVASIINSINHMILIINSKRQVVFANSSFLSLLNINPEDVYGLRLGEITECQNVLASPSGCGTSENCQECSFINSMLNLSKNDSQSTTGVIQTTKGKTFELEVKLSKLMIEGEDFVLASINDISAIKKRDEIEKIFFHDITNTSGALKGFSTLLTTLPLDEDSKAITVAIDNITQRLLDEIEAQKIISQIERENLQPIHSRFNLSSLIISIIKTYERFSFANNKIIKFELENNELSLATDKTLLSRVIINMLKNALEASGNGDTVSIDYKIANQTVTISVMNKQPIDLKFQNQIFKKRFSTKGKGRGLGTYSIKMLTENYLKGKVTFKSNIETGTIFSIELPLN